MQLVTFKIGRELYGLDIQRIQEIIVPESVATVPNLPNFIEGIMDLRGTVFPVVDMRKRFRAQEPDPVGRVIIASVHESLVGLRVDSVDRVVRVEADAMKPPPRMLADLGAKFVSDVYERSTAEGGLILILDLDKLFAEEEMASIGAVAL